MPARDLKTVDSAAEVGVDDVAGRAAIASEHGGFGAAFQNQVDLADLVEVGGLADIAEDELDARGAQARQVQLRAAALEVVERDDAHAFAMGLEAHGQA